MAGPTRISYAQRVTRAAPIERLAGRIILLWGWRRFLLAVVTGALSAFAFAPFCLFPVLFLTVPMLVWLLDGAEGPEGAGLIRRLLPAAAIGWAFGFGFFLAGLWWIGMAFLTDGGPFVILMPLAVLLLPALLALYWAAAGAAARAIGGEGPARIPAFATAFTIAEYARGHLLTGFPWNAFGYALTPVPLMMQSASLVGVWGLTLVAFFVFAAPAVLGDGRRRGRAVIIGAAALLIVAHAGFGVARLAGASDATVTNVNVRIVQPAIPQDERWQAASADAIMDQYGALSRMPPEAPSAPSFTVLVWPESAFPFFLTEKPGALSAIADILPPGTTLLTGAARRDPEKGPAGPSFNSVYAIGDTGEIEAAYDKVHLVPFGEYLPWRQLFDLVGLHQMVAIPGGFAPGSGLRTLSVGNLPPLEPLVCYEIIFPAEVVSASNRPEWLLNVTNDAWYGNTPGPYQHFLQAEVRAVEAGLPLVRAANSGISAIIDAYGRIRQSLAFDQVGIVDGGLPQALPQTFYARFGDIILAAMLLASGLSIILCKVYL